MRELVTSGCSIQLRSIRLPMAVLVLSSTQSRVPRKGILAQLETRLRQETGIPKLKIGYNHVFGYFIEVSNSYKNMVPESYIRKQTLTTGERYITQELKELESKILGAHERLIALEHRLFDELLESISAQLDRIQCTANAVAVAFLKISATSVISTMKVD